MAEQGTKPSAYDVAVVGGGPAGLAAATRLRQRGIERVVVLERERHAGGIPRHCGHPPFGMREFKRCLSGPRYAAALVERALSVGAEIRLQTTVVAANQGGHLLLSTPDGLAEISAKRVILATGVRETPRSARFVSGARPLGILTTGALQAMVYLKQALPFRRPLIVGSELVSFSALLTCRHGGIKPVAMIEQNAKTTAWATSRALPAILGVPLMMNTHLLEILGKGRVSGVRLRDGADIERAIECDGVLFTGRFTPESSLIRMGHLALDPATGGPIVDNFSRCSDPAYFAVGNLLRPVETAGWCWQEGRDLGDFLFESLRGAEPKAAPGIEVRCTGPVIRFAVPQRIFPGKGTKAMGRLQLRFGERAKGCLSVMQDGKPLWSRQITALPERRTLIPLHALAVRQDGGPIDIAFANTNPH
jgi:NADPH-dependent 2,4-dienoyl-CoA reductase/sulfur reductase-like enzyme